MNKDQSAVRALPRAGALAATPQRLSRLCPEHDPLTLPAPRGQNHLRVNIAALGDVGASLLLGLRLLGGGEDGLAGHGRARHGIHREALGSHNRGRDFLNRRVADSGGLRVLDNLNGGDRAALHGHGDLHRAADALTLAGVRSGRHLRRRTGGEQHHGARHNCDDFLLHGGSPFSFPSFSQE